MNTQIDYEVLGIGTVFLVLMICEIIKAILGA